MDKVKIQKKISKSIHNSKKINEALEKDLDKNNFFEIPTNLTQLLLINKNKPMMYNISLVCDCNLELSLFVKHIFNYGFENNIKFEYKNIILYCYKFTNFENNGDTIICNEEVGNKALDICKEKKLTPYKKSDEDIDDKKLDIDDDIISLLKDKHFIKIKYEKNKEKKEIFINLNKLSINFINIIINSMKTSNQVIKFNDNIIYDCHILSEEENKIQDLKYIYNFINMLKN